MYPGQASRGLRTGRITCSQTSGKTLCGAVEMVFLETLLDLPAAAWESVPPEVYVLLLDRLSCENSVEYLPEDNSHKESCLTLCLLPQATLKNVQIASNTLLLVKARVCEREVQRAFTEVSTSFHPQCSLHTGSVLCKTHSKALLHSIPRKEKQR